MILRDLLEIISTGQVINILYDHKYVGCFMASFIPEEYKDYHVSQIASDYFDGNSPLDGSTLDISIDKK